jgi:hypothetical protein
MKTKKIDAKSFLNVKTLSPLEENEIKGGIGVKVTVKETVTVTES